MASQKYGVPDAENPEWTAEDVANARPGRDVLPADFVHAADARRRRGPQKAPTKRLVSLRLDADVLERFRSTGKGWQVRINETLAAHLPRARRSNITIGMMSKESKKLAERSTPPNRSATRAEALASARRIMKKHRRSLERLAKK